jgi:large subunit ribosomal protein L24e
MPICSFSGKDIPAGTGIMYVKKDGKVLWFLNSKAEKNYLKLRRKPRNVKWTAEARAQKKADMAALKRVEEEKKAPKKATKGGKK